MSERELTEDEARVLEELAEMRESDPEGYRALLGDLSAESEADPALRHAEQLLQMFDARGPERDKELSELLNAAFRAQARADGDRP